jgi:uncharacterized membrane protein (DUF4010 family)
LVVGLEREWAHKEVGARTFAITTLLGVLASLLAREFVIAALIGSFLFVVLLNVHSLFKDHSLKMTTSAALVVMLMLGALIGEGHYFIAAASTILMTMLLAWKVELVRFADALLVHEIWAAVLLALMSVVIYPLLPDRLVDPWALVKPRQAWVTVIAIASIGFLNYVLLRLYSMRGLYYAALLGGLVNSTAAVAELSASLKASERRPTTRAVALILLTTVAVFPRNLVILGLFARTALPTAFPLLATMAGAAMLFEWWQRGRPEAPMQPPRLASPLSLRRVLHFGLLFLAVDAAGSLAQRYLGNLGFLVVGLVGGLVSSASTTATAAALATTGTISAETAEMATILTSMTSALVNIPIVYQQTRQTPLTRRLTLLSLVIAMLGLAILVLSAYVR